MDLHRAGSEPDWKRLPKAERNIWQRVASLTHGLVTPANVVSSGGAVLAFVGLFAMLQGQMPKGLVFLVAGRLLDAVDGAIAEATGTKSPLGELVDAALDKAVIFGMLAVLLRLQLVPIWLVAVVGLHNLANALISLYGGQRGNTVQPNRIGKLSAAGYWVGLPLFVLAALGLPLSLPLAYGVMVFSFAAGLFATYSYWLAARGRILPRAASKLFDHVLVIRNPVSSDAHKTNERIEVLRRLLPDSKLHIIQSVPGGTSANATLLRNHQDLLGPRTLLCIAAGDGTVHLILNSLLHDAQLSENAKQTPLLPLWCGNANDLAYMLNGAWSVRRLRDILNRGSIVRVKPLECRLRDVHGKESTVTASSYASFGASAYVTEELERTIPRGSPTRRFIASRFGQEIFAVLRALAQAPTFTITERGHTSIIYERTYLNGSRFAKVIGLPLKLTDEKFHRNTVERKHLLVLVLHVIGLINNREIVKRAITHDMFAVHDMVWAQFDGEPRQLPSGTQVEISVSPRPFYALSLRLG